MNSQKLRTEMGLEQQAHFAVCDSKFENDDFPQCDTGMEGSVYRTKEKLKLNLKKKDMKTHIATVVCFQIRMTLVLLIPWRTCF